MHERLCNDSIENEQILHIIMMGTMLRDVFFCMNLDCLDISSRLQMIKHDFLRNIDFVKDFFPLFFATFNLFRLKV